MMRFKCLIVLCFLMLVALPRPVMASFWFECKVLASLVQDVTQGVYLASIHEATILDGHVPKGDVCLEDKIGKDVSITLSEQDEIVQGQVWLHYSYYNGMGPNGVVEDEKWSLLSSITGKDE